MLIGKYYHQKTKIAIEKRLLHENCKQGKNTLYVVISYKIYYYNI